jgi:uncharacterized repeat protein (TIGR03837 family)
MLWDLFCRVVDNFGDIGVCWRLAADLASRGEQVRLWVDDPSALAWMAPDGASGVTVLRWSADAGTGLGAGAGAGAMDPGDVVVEAFGCDPPVPFVQRMATRRVAPVWINLEYLSAEAAAERNHGLRSPQLGGPGEGLNKWFFYPGFSEGTGGLIREPGLLAAQQRFDAGVWLHGKGIAPREGEQRVSLFCYGNPALPGLLDVLAQTPTLLLATAGQAARQVQQALGPRLTRGTLRAVVLPWLTQHDFDALLWSCDLNFVRGEDSFVRAQWAGKPFVWQIYPQNDRAHEAKLEAFLSRFLAPAEAGLRNQVRRLWRSWNGLSGEPIDAMDLQPWQRHGLVWRNALLTQADLTSALLRFVAERR